MSVFEPRWEVLPTAQRQLWPQLKASVDLGLVLYGGTAAALRLGHRCSLDFDFFTDKPLDREALNHAFPFLRDSTVVRDRPDTLSVLAGAGDAGVRVSFFGRIDIGRVGIPDRTADAVMDVASLLDLLATKLKVALQRIEAKDYRDIAAILGTGLSLEEGLASATALYGLSFQPSEAVKALSYFEGGDLMELQESEKKPLLDAVARLRRIPVAALVSRSLSA